MSITTNEMNDDSTVYKTLLESTKAIPWKIDWDSMQFVYIGPQIKELLGWERESWKSVDDWITRMHEDDRERVANFCVAQSKAGIDHEADYRALTSDGDYVWIRDVVHVVRRDDGSVDSLIGFMFDISERKKTEEKLVDLQKELEDLSFKDGLTGVANRRMFDSILDLEWSNARRSKRPLSLILLDIDFFKEYNDFYGHLRGDDCLKLVAQTLGAAATRARDFFARFGGEEFIFVLPETDAEAAEKIAERCQELIAKLEIPHQGSKVSDCLTVSMGIGTIVPVHGDEQKDFVELVDQRLYAAKDAGRNQMVSI